MQSSPVGLGSLIHKIWKDKKRHSLRALYFFAIFAFIINSSTIVTLAKTDISLLIPSIPTNFSATAETTTSIVLAWSPSIEIGGTIAGYKVYRNGALLTTITTGVNSNSYANNSLTPNTSYIYTVASYDAAGTTSAQSSPITVKTLASMPTIIGNNSFGVSTGQTFMSLDPTTLNANLANLVSMGITWIRFDIQWDDVQPNNSTSYDWGAVDNLVAAANAHHLKMLAILDYTPKWAQTQTCAATVGTDRCPPADPAQFATFAQAVATRYTPQGIIDWEIWNEPNLGPYWMPAANTSAYAAVLKAAFTAIKNVNPAAGIITGGMGPGATSGGNISPTDFLTQLYAAGAKSYFNAVGFHPYSYPAMPSYYATWNAWSQMAQTPTSLRSIMTANGDSPKRIWMTEYGAPTGGPGVVETSASDTLFLGSPDHVTEALQAQMISQAITLVQQDTWAGPLFIFTYKDQGNSQITNQNFFGIFRYDSSNKPAYTTIQTLL